MVFVEKKVADDVTLTNDEAFSPICKKLCTFREGVVSPETPRLCIIIIYLCQGVVAAVFKTL